LAAKLGTKKHYRGNTNQRLQFAGAGVHGIPLPISERYSMTADLIIHFAKSFAQGAPEDGKKAAQQKTGQTPQHGRRKARQDNPGQSDCLPIGGS
jgi:hypothetical protein